MEYQCSICKKEITKEDLRSKSKKKPLAVFLKGLGPVHLCHHGIEAEYQRVVDNAEMANAAWR
jgi:hypothetical protein